MRDDMMGDGTDGMQDDMENERPPPLPDTEIAISTKMYLATLVSLVLSIVPTVSMAVVSTILLTVLLVAAYVIRGRVADGGLAHHHMSYVIRTTWIGGFYLIVLMVFSSVYMTGHIDYSPIEPCAQRLVEMGAGSSEAAIMQMAQPCLDHFMAVNEWPFTLAFWITSAPLLVFFFVRFGRGFMLARQGLKMPKPKSWL